MGKQPAVLIIARHGARLDAEDKEWHDNSLEPWNSPLSYGGWSQTQSLGARIGTELYNLDNPTSIDGLARDSSAATPRPRKRRKIIIHSSPYLRCIQTSIGIAAGIRQPQDTVRSRPAPTPFQRSSLSRPPMMAGDATSPPHDGNPQSPPLNQSRQETILTDLKIDAWLGEWLSAGYFDKSKPPPSSEVLVKDAKEVLRRPPEEIRGADLATTSIQEFDEIDWADRQKDTKDAKALPTHEKTGLRAMAAKGYSMPRRSRTVSLSTNQNGTSSTQNSEPIGRRPRSTTYSPPVPTYSIAPKDTIPLGFVAHARDACVDPDFEWDSQQAPLYWPDGGQYEEEWSTMHRRFRNGLQSLLSFYETDSDAMDIDDDTDEDLVVILVTHQAGCNALIRLVTGAPALHDVGTASLTLAVRKPGLTRQQSAKSSASPTRRRGSLDLGINDDFDMRIIASTEHLRSGSNPLGLNSPRLGVSPAIASRRMVGPDSVEGFSIGDPMTWRSSSQTTVGRSPSVHSNNRGSISAESHAAAGLWSMRDNRSSSISSETSVTSVDPRSVPNPRHSHKSSLTDLSSSVILEDEAIERHAGQGRSDPQSHVISPPAALDEQSTWQPNSTSAPKRLPVRSGSTKLLSNPTAGTGLWGSPVSNPGGVKEGTPHSRGSFGMSDAATPMWGSRPGTQRNSWLQSKTEFTTTVEEDEP